MEYRDTKLKLTSNAYIVIFFKADGSLRCMLCTRNSAMAANIAGFFASGLESRDIKHNESTGALAVIDLEKKDIRAFVVDRTVTIIEVGDMRDAEAYKLALDKLYQIRAEYEKNMAEVNFESL